MAPVACCLEIAEQPNWVVGDTWIFERTDGPPTTATRWTRKVLAALPNGNFDVMTGGTEWRAEFDQDGNMVDTPGPDFACGRFKFPMSLGAKWTKRCKLSDTLDGTQVSSWEVKAYETIAVPAGAFDCFRVEGEANSFWPMPLTTSHVNYMRAHSVTTYWYCPAIKSAAKWQTSGTQYFSAPLLWSVTELLSFDRGR
jgi:hypothetical protein